MPPGSLYSSIFSTDPILTCDALTLLIKMTMNQYRMYIASLLILLGFMSAPTFATDIGHPFKELIKSNFILSKTDKVNLKNTQVIFIPGILSESFILGDFRSLFEFSLFTKGYFSEHLDTLESHGIDCVRITSSSDSFSELRDNIEKVINEAVQKNKKIIFIAHSLGGLALIDLLIQKPQYLKFIRGNFFLQSPLYGSPMADLYLENPFHIRSITRLFLPFLHTSEDVINALSTKSRKTYMQRNRELIQNFLSKSNNVFLTSYANKSKSLFKPTIDILEYGCVMRGKKCFSSVLYHGTRGYSDGMVPLGNGIIYGSPYIILDNVDHGETVLNTFHDDLSRKTLTHAIISTLLKRERSHESRSLPNNNKSQ